MVAAARRGLLLGIIHVPDMELPLKDDIHLPGNRDGLGPEGESLQKCKTRVVSLDIKAYRLKLYATFFISGPLIHGLNLIAHT
jgi:hypothetical protein